MNYFDLHSDTPYECYTKNQEFYVNRLAVSGQNGERFDAWYHTFAVWIRDGMENPWQFYLDVIKDFKSKLSYKPKNLTPLFSVEGGDLLEGKTERLYRLKRDGISFLALAWNGENALAGGISSEKGLSDIGAVCIRLMNRLKIGCDLSHLNEKSFYRAAELSSLPLATHSNCFYQCRHKRNLKDEQIRLIAEKNGLLGLCFYPEFLSGNIYQAIYENIIHLLELGYESIIAIGSDFDGAKMDKALQNIGQIPLLYGFLEQKGLDSAILNKIFYENAHNFIAKLS